MNGVSGGTVPARLRPNKLPLCAKSWLIIQIHSLSLICWEFRRMPSLQAVHPRARRRQNLAKPPSQAGGPNMSRLSPDDLLPRMPPETDSWWPADRAPLKRNALATLRAPLAAMGFATTPVKAQKESFAVRIVWVYPSLRGEPPYTCYEPV